ncbi:MAG: ABC transporter permease [Acidimicrobiaceae bacterium]|nr:ABC transporter permease [Acidimicrobiaceae bacterium]MYF43786.1 ABC transporter permease [Acidimicrobiaceae bacterium]MYJ36285.1 ABC transporter permease [Acidimicrobiaceae bacterium]
MLRVTARRLAWSVPLAITATAVSFILVAFLPGDAAVSLVGRNATEEQLKQVREDLGLEQPVWAQYGQWLEGAVRGDLGNSMINRQPVTAQLNGRLAPSMSLIVGATLIATTLGVAIGILGAQRGRIGRVIDSGSIGGLAVPDFWLGLVLIVLFAVHLGWFPPTGYVRWNEGVGPWMRSVALPIATLSVPATAILARQTREAMSTALSKEYVRTLRAAGIGECSILFRHGLRNAAIPVVTVVGLVFIGSLGGTVAVESVFAIPGLGSTAVHATATRDLPLIQGVVVYFTLIVIVVNLLVDLAYRYLDPRLQSATATDGAFANSGAAP